MQTMTENCEISSYTVTARSTQR